MKYFINLALLNDVAKREELFKNLKSEINAVHEDLDIKKSKQDVFFISVDKIDEDLNITEIEFAIEKDMIISAVNLHLNNECSISFYCSNMSVILDILHKNNMFIEYMDMNTRFVAPEDKDVTLVSEKILEYPIILDNNTLEKYTPEKGYFAGVEIIQIALPGAEIMLKNDKSETVRTVEALRIKAMAKEKSIENYFLNNYVDKTVFEIVYEVAVVIESGYLTRQELDSDKLIIASLSTNKNRDTILPCPINNLSTEKK